MIHSNWSLWWLFWTNFRLELQVLKLRLSKVRREPDLSTCSPEQNLSSATQNGWFLREIVQHNLRTGVGKKKSEEHLNVWLFFVIGHKTNGNIQLHADWFLTKSLMTRSIKASNIFTPLKICAKCLTSYVRPYQSRVVWVHDWWWRNRSLLLSFSIVDRKCRSLWLRLSIGDWKCRSLWLRLSIADWE